METTIYKVTHNIERYSNPDFPGREVSRYFVELAGAVELFNLLRESRWEGEYVELSTFAVGLSAICGGEVVKKSEESVLAVVSDSDKIGAEYFTR